MSGLLLLSARASLGRMAVSPARKYRASVHAVLRYDRPAFTGRPCEVTRGVRVRSFDTAEPDYKAWLRSPSQSRQDVRARPECSRRIEPCNRLPTALPLTRLPRAAVSRAV